MSDQAQAVDPVAAIAGILERQAAPETPEPETAPEATTEDIPAEAAESPPEATADEVEQADDAEDVDYDGETYRVPKKLKDALMRQADYTRKTQEVAEQRRTLEAHQAHLKAQEVVLQQQQQFAQVASQEMAEIKASENALAQYAGVDWNALSDSDPVAAQKHWIAYQTLQTKHNQLSAGLNQKYQQFARQLEQHQRELSAKGMEILKKDIPGWGEAMAQELKRMGRETYGFSDAELDSVTDPRTVKLLADAAAYRKLQQAKPDIQKRVAQAPKTIQPSAQQTNKQRQTQAVQDAKARLRKTGKVEDAAAVFARIL